MQLYVGSVSRRKDVLFLIENFAALAKDGRDRRLDLRELESEHNHYVAARVDGELVGYAGIARLGRRAPYEYEIHTIGVAKTHQGQGIGRALLSRLLDIASGGVVFLEVRTDNTAAIGLYESFGFAVVGVRKRYYRVSGTDAYTMRREAT